MKDRDQMQKLRKRYIELVKIHGEEIAELDSFREALLELNRKHREAALAMYSRIISKIERKTGRTKAVKQ